MSLCSKCGYPMERTVILSNLAGNERYHLECEHEPAHIELARLKEQLDEAEKQLSAKISELTNSFEHYGHLPGAREAYIQQRWGYKQALNLLHKVRNGELEVRKEGKIG